MKLKLYIAGLILLGLCVPVPAQRCLGLKAWYDDYNKEYFSHKLPDQVIIERLYRKDVLAWTSKDEAGTFHITFSTAFKLGERHEHLTLLHEMCHVKTWDEVADGTEHGRKWKICMYTLRSEGAFDSSLIEAYDGH